MQSSNADPVLHHAGPLRHPVRDGELRVSERDEAGSRVIAVAGDLDLSNAPSMCLRLEAARRGPRPRVVVDLSELTFCDSTGLRALILAGQEITASAGVFRVVLPPTDDGAVARMFRICGAEEHFAVFPSVERALAALRSRT